MPRCNIQISVGKRGGYDCLKAAKSIRHRVSDVNEWINEIPIVPISSSVKPQPRERAQQTGVGQQGKKITTTSPGAVAPGPFFLLHCFLKRAPADPPQSWW